MAGCILSFTKREIENHGLRLGVSLGQDLDRTWAVKLPRCGPPPAQDKFSEKILWFNFDFFWAL
jgi:hypothetical protein